MPRIPRSEVRTRLPLAPSVGVNVGGAAAGAVGRAIEQGFGQLGRSVEGLGQALQRQQEKSDAVAAAKTVAETRAFWQRQLIERAEQAPEDITGFHDQVLEAFDGDVAARLETAPATAADFLEIQMAQLREDIGTKAATIESRGRVERRNRDLAAIVSLNANAVRTDETQLGDALSEALGAVAALDLPEAQNAAAVAEVRRSLTKGLVQGLNERDPERARALLEAGTFDGDLAEGDKNTLVNDNQVELRRREVERRQRAAQAQAERRALQTELRQEVRGALGIMGEGFNPGGQVLADLERRAERLQDAQALAMLQDAKALNVFRTEASQLTPPDLQGFVNREATRLAEKPAAKPSAPGVTAFELERLKLAEELLGTMNRELGKDPLSFASRVGVVRLEPLQLFDPPAEDGGAPDFPAARASIVKRISDALVVAGHYGVEPRFLTDEEAGQMASAFADNSVDGQMALLAAISQGFGTHTPDVLAEFRAEKPTIAHVGGLLTINGRPETARDALTGIKALEAGNAVLPPATEIAEWGDDVLGTAFGSVPATRSAVLDTAKAIYHTRAVRRGQAAPEDVDEALFKRALQEAAGAVFTPRDVQFGGIATWRGNEVVVPPEIAADDFADVIRRLEDQDLELASDGGGAPRHEDGTPFTAEELHDDAYLVSIGHGRYLVSMTDPVDGPPAWVMGTGPNSHYVLDLTRIARQIAAGTRGITLPLPPEEPPEEPAAEPPAEP